MIENFSAPRFIEHKRDKNTHNTKDIQAFVDAVTNQQIEPYQISAWLMATFLNGLNDLETSDLTTAMSRSGTSLNWSLIDKKFQEAHLVDKHSTGGVGDKVSLILAPLAASMGMTVPMMSGQGLAQTGGTVDKLLSIPGFRMDLGVERMAKQLLDIGACMIRQTSDYCPADKTLYALRDVTATVPSIPLITASILSKKIAEGVKSLVIDLKTGPAAFMKDMDSAKKLAASLVRVSREAGLKTHVVLTKMNHPLGTRVGNALEVIESLEILSQSYPSDIHKQTSLPLEALCIDLCAEMGVACGLYNNFDHAKQDAIKHLKNGSALETFLKLCSSQGADKDWQKKIGHSKYKEEIKASNSGFVKSIDALNVGWMGVEIHVGRARANDPVDPHTGFEFLVKPGDFIKKGDTLGFVHLNEKNENVIQRTKACIHISEQNSDEFIKSNDLVIERIQNV